MNVEIRQYIVSSKPELVTLLNNLSKISLTKDVTDANRSLLAILQASTNSKEAALSKELHYTIWRLINSLCSPKLSTLNNCSTALSLTLKEFPVVTTTLVFQELASVTKTLKSGDEVNTRIGRLMVYLALLRADRTEKAEDVQVSEIVENTVKIYREKASLQTVAGQVIMDVIMAVSRERFQRTVYPSLQSELEAGWSHCKPDQLLWVLTARRAGKLDGDAIETHWGHKQLLHQTTYKKLLVVLKHCAKASPAVHPVAHTLVQTAKQLQVLDSFWKTVVEEGLLTEDTQCIHLAVEMAATAITLCDQKDLVKVILSNRLQKAIFAKANSCDSIAKAFGKLIEGTHKLISQHNKPKLQLTVIKCFTSVASRNVQLHNKLVQTLPSKMCDEALERWTKLVIDQYKGNAVIGMLSAMGGDAREQWLHSHIGHLLNTEHNASPSSSSSSTHIYLLAEFLLTAAFFTPQAQQKSGKNKPKERNRVALIFEKSIAVLCEGKNHKTAAESLVKIFTYADKLLSSSGERNLNNAMDSEHQKLWKKIFAVIKKIDALPVEEIAKTRCTKREAFLLICVPVGLMLLNKAKEVQTFIQDLCVCYERAFESPGKEKKKKKSKESEPAWIEVLVEMLLNMLAEHSTMRTTVTITCTAVMGELTPAAVQLIVDALEQQPGEDGPVEFDGDEDDEDDDGDVSDAEMVPIEEIDMDGSVGASGGEESSDSDESSDEDEEEEDEDGMEVNEDLRKQIKAALGEAAAPSDSEAESGDEIEMTDEDMMKFDSKLTAAFRSISRPYMKNQQRLQKEQLTHYKNRCMDIVEHIINRCQSLSLVSMLIPPLLSLSAGDQQGTSQRAAGLLMKLSKAKQLIVHQAAELDTLVEMFEDVITASKINKRQQSLKQSSTALMFIVRMLHSKQADTFNAKGEECRKCIVQCVRSQFTAIKNRTQQPPTSPVSASVKPVRQEFIDPMLMLPLLSNHSVVFWTVTEDLLKIIEDDKQSPRLQISMMSLLSTMINKNTKLNVGDEQWERLCTPCVAVVQKTMSDIPDGKDKKAKLRRESLILLHRVLIVSPEYKESLSSEFAESVTKFKSTVKNRQEKGICNKILAMWTQGRKNNSKPSKVRQNSTSEATPQNGEPADRDNGQQETKKDKKKKRKRKHSETT